MPDPAANGHQPLSAPKQESIKKVVIRRLPHTFQQAADNGASKEGQSTGHLADRVAQKGAVKEERGSASGGKEAARDRGQQQQQLLQQKLKELTQRKEQVCSWRP